MKTAAGEGKTSSAAVFIYLVFTDCLLLTKRVGSRAFAECGRLTLIYMPDSIEHIAANAFTDSSYVVFLCASDNAAAAFARENHIPYFTGE